MSAIWIVAHLVNAFDDGVVAHRLAVDLLGEALPNAKVATLKGAGHMSPFTHPAELNRLILDHLAAQR